MALIDKLSAIGDAIRTKTGGTELMTLDEMPTAIESITTGGGDIEIPVTTGNCRHRFANGGWDWFIEEFGDKITTKDITDSSYMFNMSSTLTNIPFEINCSTSGGASVNVGSMFYGCDSLTTIPKMTGRIGVSDSMFRDCRKLKELPEDIESWFYWNKIDDATSGYAFQRSRIFDGCYSLRSFPMGFLNHEVQTRTSGSSSIYYYGFTNCYVLDEIVGLPVHYRDNGITSSFFNSTFYRCYRLKNMTFAVQEDGTPYIAKWKNQTIDLKDLGAVLIAPRNLAAGSVSSDKKVVDDATYQALKDDPDWWTENIAYSRYNHDSAVATINSLPDTSAYGTNTIKFTGASGELTDGGAINTLTDEEIAVAAAKGWTVTLV